MTLALAPNRQLTAPNLLVCAHTLTGLRFAEEGHRIKPETPEVAERGYYLEGEHAEGQGDCVFYILRVLRIPGLWPEEWNDELPLELRQVRLTYGSRLSTLDDFPVIGQFLEANAVKVEDGPRDGDLVLMRWGTREGAPHHVALWAGYGFYHLPFGGVSCWQQTDATWNEKVVEVWRLNAVIQGEDGG